MVRCVVRLKFQILCRRRLQKLVNKLHTLNLQYVGISRQMMAPEIGESGHFVGFFSLSKTFQFLFLNKSYVGFN